MSVSRCIKAMSAIIARRPTLSEPTWPSSQTQFPSSSQDIPAAPTPTPSLLKSSPYDYPTNFLDLSTLDTPDLLFAKAMTAFESTRPDYATQPYAESFNFSEVLTLLRSLAAAEQYTWKEHVFYVVVFQSTLKRGADGELLHKLDQESHREACASGGLLKYWFGSPDGERRNLATCYWSSRDHARRGGTGPWHKKARAAAGQLYDRIDFSTYRFTISEGATDFSLESWT
ncbi:hypothetical protein ANO11243_076170 [Dothideomycetidae sp. 11243]|nr:hypothetical protein ANO11243_076170 [fungal sp. No.11243]